MGKTGKTTKFKKTKKLLSVFVVGFVVATGVNADCHAVTISDWAGVKQFFDTETTETSATVDTQLNPTSKITSKRTDAVTLQGKSQDNSSTPITINGKDLGNMQAFKFNAGTNTTLQNFRFADFYNIQYSSVMENQGILYLTDIDFIENSTYKKGGVINNTNTGILTLKDVFFYNNYSLLKKNGINDINNDGSLLILGTLTYMTGGITGNGSTTIGDGENTALLTLANTATIEQENLTIRKNASVSVNASGIIVTNDISNSGTLILQDEGVLSTKISGNGSVIIDGNITSNATIDNPITVRENQSFTSDMQNIGKTITNNGTFNVSGNINKDIDGNGTTILNDNISVQGEERTISGTLELNNQSIDMTTDTTNQYTTLNTDNLKETGNLKINTNMAKNESKATASDKIHINSGINNDATLNLTDIKVTNPTDISDRGTYDNYVVYADGELNSVTMQLSGSTDTDTVYSTTDGTNQYYFSLGSKKGTLKAVIDKITVTLSEYITGSTKTARELNSYNINTDLSVNKTIGTTAEGETRTGGNVLTINLNNGSTLTATEDKSVDGINIEQDYTLNIDGSNSNGATITNFDTALTNNGTLKLNNITFEGNNIDAVNNSNITIEGGTVLLNSGIIQDTGRLIINNDAQFGVSHGIFKNNTIPIWSSALTNNGTILYIGTKGQKTIFENNFALHGGAILNNNKIGSINADFSNNTASDNGGAIANSGGTIDSISGTFTNNFAKVGGAIFNNNKIGSINADFSNNSVSDNGGAIANSGGTIDSISGTFTNNFAKVGGAIYNTGTLTINNTIFTDNYMTDSRIETLNDIHNEADLHILGTNFMTGGISDKGTMQGTTTIGDGKTETTLTLADTATLNQNTIILNNNATLNIGLTAINNTATQPFNNFVLNGGLVNISNNLINNLNINNLQLNGNPNIAIDVDLANKTMDTLNVNRVSGDGILHISDINLLSVAKEDFTTINFTSSQSLMGQINYSGSTPIIYSPIYQYAVGYNPSNGNLGFSREFNPAILASSVGAEVGAYLTQINNYEQAFGNMDMMMLMTKEQRQAMKLANKYASTDTQGMTYTPNQIPEQDKGIWFRPYTTFEKVNLSNGPNVENTAYGTLIGADSDLTELSNGWDMVYGAYAGYNGSHQSYDSVGIYQNGGVLGLNAAFYKGNFFTGITANVGASVAEADTIYGNEDFTMLSAGIASKTGYNWELFNSKFIIQPSLLLSYTFINTFDYTNAAGIGISSDPLNAIQIVPGIKLIGNLPNSWQPYLGVQMVWSIMDKTKFYANDIGLSQMSLEPYIQYGLGVQKRFGERFTGYLQAMLRNGGRTGIALSAGLRWTLGK